jgi:hypothetical protein
MERPSEQTHSCADLEVKVVGENGDPPPREDHSLHLGREDLTPKASAASLGVFDNQRFG